MILIQSTESINEELVFCKGNEPNAQWEGLIINIDGKGVLRLYHNDANKTFKASFNLTLWSRDEIKGVIAGKRSFRISFETEEGVVHFAFDTAEHRQIWMDRMTRFMADDDVDIDSVVAADNAIYELPKVRELRTSLLISGYVRAMDEYNVFSAEIPSVVHDLCLRFYFEPLEEN